MWPFIWKAVLAISLAVVALNTAGAAAKAARDAIQIIWKAPREDKTVA